MPLYNTQTFLLGLNEALNIFKNTSGIKILYLNEKDVIRHKLVKKVIAAYN